MIEMARQAAPITPAYEVISILYLLASQSRGIKVDTLIMFHREEPATCSISNSGPAGAGAALVISNLYSAFIAVIVAVAILLASSG